jgi:C-terminal processing protease CtpA/Prc
VQRRLPKLAALFVVVASCAGRPGSIGAVLAQANADGRVTVRETPPGYPAERAGVTPGDEVLLIDGRDVRGMSPQAIHQALEGDVGSTVQLTLLRRGKVERVAMKRAPLASTGSR